MDKEKIKPIDLAKKVYSSMLAYGKAVNEERAIPDFRDGLKPVQRKVLWAMYKLNLAGKSVKTARVVGDVLGKYHPHGDKAAQDAIETLVRLSLSPITGEGNWGSITGDGAAAMRYTLVKLSEYGASFFDPYYMPIMDMVPTYDAGDVEPVILLPMLPNLLLNGTSGIGVGATSDIPAYTRKSVAEVLIYAIQNGGATPQSCLNLVFTDPAGGLVSRKAQKKELLAFYKHGHAAIRFRSRLEYDDKKKAFVLTGVAPFKGSGDYMNRIFAVPDKFAELTAADDQSGKWNLDVRFPMKRGRDVETIGKKLSAYLSSLKHYKVNVTKRELTRTKEGWPVVDVKFQRSTVPDIINAWLIWRRDLEIRATEWQKAKLEGEIRKTEVLILAVQFRDFIMSLIRDQKASDVDLKKRLKAKLKLVDNEVDMVWGLRWPQLRALEGTALQKTLKQQHAQRKEYEQRIDKPESWIIESIKKHGGIQ